MNHSMFEHVKEWKPTRSRVCFDSSRGQEGADRLDRVRLGCTLVGPVCLHARKPERHAARILRTPLNIVERDLDDELRTHINNVTVAANFTSQ